MSFCAEWVLSHVVRRPNSCSRVQSASTPRLTFRASAISGISLCAIISSPAFAQEAETETVLPPVVVEAPSAPAPKKKSAVKKSKPAVAASAPQVQQAAPPPPANIGPYASPNAQGVVGYVATRSTTATKTDTPLVDVPQSVSVVTKEQIKDQSMKSMGDVLRYVPGVTPGQGEGNRDQITIRGQNTTADFFTDGVRDDVQYFRDFYNIDRVEVLKGPNAMIFGRGGGGGVVNRVTKKAEFDNFAEGTVTFGSFDDKRATVDVNGVISPWAALRINGVYEDANSYRDHVGLERYGINPTLHLKPADRTHIWLSYEHFEDRRTADRGIPSFAGWPAPTPYYTFFGNPDASYSDADINVGTAIVEHVTDFGLKIRNTTLLGNYDKFYQNVYPSGPLVMPAGTVALSAYNNATDRTNLFNQTDLTYKFGHDFVRHTVLVGTEFSRQWTDSYRETGRFNVPGGPTSINVPFASPTVYNPVFFANNGTSDANNSAVSDVAAVYAQDQIEITRYFDVIAGVRFDRFNMSVDNFNTNTTFSRTDNLVSPRVGAVLKPMEEMSIYASYSVSYLPSSGDQFSSLSLTSRNFEPEKFTNYEVGFKYDIYPALAFTAAAYHLNRENSPAPDPNNAGQTILIGETETRGIEIGLNGYLTDKWQVSAGYAHQWSEILTPGATKGNELAMVPSDTVSLWNKYMVTRDWGAGIGIIHRTDMFAAVDNAVTLPGYTRVDAALYWNVNEHLAAQLNVENVFDTEYYVTAHNNNNITPGSPQAFYFTLSTRY